MALMDFDLGDVGSVLTSAREAITGKKIEDPMQQAKMILALDQIEADMKKSQLIVNAKEAEHKSIFVAGWRPFIGWMGGIALGYNFILQPLLYVILASNNIIIEMPTLDISTLMTLVTGMLGFGAMRSWDKIKGVGNGR